MSKQHYLLEWCGRTPEHYTLYPLPEERRYSQNFTKIARTLPTGEMHIFEFDFFVDPLPEYKFDDLAECGCITCAERNLPCPLELEKLGNGCELWAISRNAAKIAEVEYYKQLHEKHYGQTCISV